MLILTLTKICHKSMRRSDLRRKKFTKISHAKRDAMNLPNKRWNIFLKSAISAVKLHRVCP
jgi:hypothetical protein